MSDRLSLVYVLSRSLKTASIQLRHSRDSSSDITQRHEEQEKSQARVMSVRGQVRSIQASSLLVDSSKPHEPHDSIGAVEQISSPQCPRTCSDPGASKTRAATIGENCPLFSLLRPSAGSGARFGEGREDNWVWCGGEGLLQGEMAPRHNPADVAASGECQSFLEKSVLSAGWSLFRPDLFSLHADETDKTIGNCLPHKTIWGIRPSLAGSLHLGEGDG